MRVIIRIVIDGKKNAVENNQLTAMCIPSPSRCPRVFDLAFESLVELKVVQELICMTFYYLCIQGNSRV